jgi:plasmid stabilization system protein ParE
VSVDWTDQARRDRAAIRDFIAADDPRAALRLDASRLESFPESGAPGLAPGTREVFPHTSYRLVYEITNATVSILTLIHVRRQYPPVHAPDESQA